MLRNGGLRDVIGRIRHGSKRNVFDEFRPLTDRPPAQGAGRSEALANTINWVLPQFTAGSGGHTTAVRFLTMLAERGYVCRVVIDSGAWFGTAEEVRTRLEAFFGLSDTEVFVGVDTAPPCFAAIATGWEQAYAVRNLTMVHERFYFVQDFEPWFFARGSVYGFAEETYRFGFTGITAGRWLAEKLRAEYGMTCHPIGFSYDRHLYRPGIHKHVGHRVFFYTRPSTERRAFELGLLALGQLCSNMPDTTVVFAGFDLSRFVVPFAHESHGVLSPQRLADLFRTCDLALVLSMTNLSLMPLELMGSAVPVVSNSGPWTEWLLHQDYAMLAHASISTLADAMQSLLLDDTQRARLGAAGLAFAESTSWSREGDAMAAALATRGCVPVSMASASQ